MNNSRLIIILIILVASYSFFSAAETAFSSLNRVKLKTLANTGNRRAEKTLKLDEKFSKLLTTILIGNTIVNVVAASLATILFTNLYSENGVAISSIVMTIVIMIIGEILPKNIAKHMPERWAMSITPILNILVLIFTPVTIIFEFIQNIIAKTFKENDENYSTEELLTMVEEANEDGDIEDREADLITNALEFNDLDVGEIYTPRTEIVAIDVSRHTVEDIEIKYRDSGYSRLPVYNHNLDNIIGVLHVKDFYYHLIYEKNTNVRNMLQNVIYTSPQVKISSLLKQLQKSKTHMAIVCDEYGGTDGIITMEDILEELVGEIYDEHDEVIEYFKKINDNTYLVKCELDIEDFFEHFQIENKEEFEFNTTSAWVIDMFDRIPTIGESFDFDKLSIEITNADERKVNEIKVTVNDETKEDK